MSGNLERERDSFKNLCRILFVFNPDVENLSLPISRITICWKWNYAFAHLISHREPRKMYHFYPLKKGPNSVASFAVVIS